MDTKSFIFIVTFLSATVLAALAGYAMLFEKAPISSPKIYMDFIFAGVLAITSIFTFKVLETGEKA